MTAAVPPRLAHRWALLLGLVLLVPQVVIAVVVVGEPIVVGLAGFAMTLGWIRLGLLAHRVARERRPPVHRGVLAVAGAVALVVGSLLFTAATAAARAAADPGFSGAIAPAPVVGLNLVVVACAGLYVCGLVLLVGAALGAIGAARRRPAA